MSDRSKPSKRRVLQDPVKIEQEQDAEHQIDGNLSPTRTLRKGWFGRRTTSSGVFESDSADKDTAPQKTGGFLPSSKVPSSYVSLNQDPFQPGST